MEQKSSLKLKSSAGLRGRFDGFEILERDMWGKYKTIKKVEGRGNLITDSGMNNFGTSGGQDIALNPVAYLFRDYLIASSSNTDPTTATTSLTGEIGRSNSNGGFGVEEGYSITQDAANNKLVVSSTIVRVYTAVANISVASVGLTPFPTGGQLSVASRVPDGAGGFTTLNLLTGQALKVKHTLILELPWQTVSKTFNLANVGDTTGDATYFTDGQFLWQPFYVFLPIITSGSWVWRFAALANSASSARNTATTEVFSVSRGNVMVVETFVPGPDGNGKWKRRKRINFLPAEANGVHYGWALTMGFSPLHYLTGGYKFKLTNPVSYTKGNTKELILYHESQWYRAP